MFIDFFTMGVGEFIFCHCVADVLDLGIGEMLVPFTEEIHRTIVYECGVELGK